MSNFLKLLGDKEVEIMTVRFHPHAQERMAERGAAQQEVILVIETGECFKAKFGRTGFRRNFTFEKKWHGRYYKTKQVEAYAVQGR